MKKAILILIPSLIIAAIIYIAFQYFIIPATGKGALQVTSSPEGKVYLNGEYLGHTPLCKCPDTDPSGLILSGTYTIKLVPDDNKFQTYEDKIIITKSVLTVVDHKFGNGGDAEGSIISLTPLDDKKTSQILALSIPDKAEVLLDNNVSGMSPVLLKDVTESDHSLILRKQGYNEKEIRIRTPLGYKLTAALYLSTSETATASSTPAASSSAAIEETPTVSPTLSVATVTILETPTGFLRVRKDSSISSAEIGRVNPGDTLEYVDEKNGWYEIKLSDGQLGWVSAQYAKKQ